MAQSPVADFSASVTSGCAPLNVSFKDQSTGTPLYWEWDFGNGAISSQQNPTASYGAPGTYTVTLIVRNRSGANSKRVVNMITIYPSPSVQFTSSLPSGVGCAPTNISFIDKSAPGAGTITGWAWNFGDGGTSNAQNPAHVYTQTGYYTVGLTVTNSGGCSNTTAITRYLRVIPGVSANFTWTQVSSSCSPPFQLNFINQTAGPGNLTYTWDLGVGSSTNANPTATYPDNNPYTIKLHAVSDLGCSQDTQAVLSLPVGVPAITAPPNACVNTPVNFVNASTPAPVSASWDFGDGTISPSANPTKSFAATGSYTVKVVNTYAACKDSATQTIAITNNPMPTFKADHQYGCQAPFTVNFQDLTAGTTSWLWDFGDGQTSSQQNPQHTYTTAGSFDVTLTITNGSSCTGTAIQKQFIRIQPAVIGLKDYPVTGCINSPVSPVAAIDAIDGIATYSWTAPGASPTTSTMTTPVFTYTTQGTYDLSLTITTQGGCSFTKSFPGMVLIGNPSVPTFTVAPTPPVVCGKSTFTFTSTTTSPYDKLFWDFGDQTPEPNMPTATHAYTNTGNFTVQLSASNHGCLKTGNAVVVTVKPPIAKFGFTADCANKLNVDFHDSSIIDPALGATYVWDFGDGSAPLIISPTPPLGNLPGSPPQHHFPGPLPNHYTVTLTVTNGTCTDVSTMVVNLASPVPSFTAPPQACEGTSFQVISTSTPPDQIASYQWTVGTTIITGRVSFINYTSSTTGPLTLGLQVVGADGCLSPEVTSTINIIGPTARFTAPNGGCLNGDVVFKDQSTSYPGNIPITTWTWNFGDGAQITIPPPGPYAHPYADTGLYRVSLTVTDANGCSNTYQAPPQLYITAPRAGFFADTFYCPDKPVLFTDTSTGYLLSYNWDFGDTTGSNQVSPTHPFLVDGKIYSVKLKVTDAHGCTDSVTHVNGLHIQAPVPAFTMTDSIGICVPLQANFTANGLYYDSLYWDFGDGTTSTLPATGHFFNSFGIFPVSLFLRGPGGCLASTLQHVHVINPQTGSTFTYSPAPLQACDSLLVKFDVIPPAFTKFTLNFGDGQVDSSQNGSPAHLYKQPSTFSPTMLLQDSSGCIVTIGSSSGNILIMGAVPIFTMNQHKFCDNGTVSFTDFVITNDGPYTETWSFGDGATATGSNPEHTYVTPGNLPVTLNITTQHNCQENYTDTVFIFQTPHPLITLSQPNCVNSPINFQGGLTTPEVDSVIWRWDFGNGSTSSQQNPALAFDTAANYTVRLNTSVSFGCTDSAKQQLTINPLPSIKGPNQLSTPVGMPVTIPFTYSPNIAQYVWHPAGNLNCTDCSNPTASPTFTTTYYVTVTDDNNCSSSDSVEVKTICNDKNYFLPNTFSPNGDGVNDVFYPRGSNLYNIQSMRVFNRWGQMVFERRNFPANSASYGWDGNFNGRPAPADAYVYVVEVICNNAQIVALRGDVVLVR